MGRKGKGEERAEGEGGKGKGNILATGLLLCTTTGPNFEILGPRSKPYVHGV